MERVRVRFRGASPSGPVPAAAVCPARRPPPAVPAARRARRLPPAACRLPPAVPGEDSAAGVRGDVTKRCERPAAPTPTVTGMSDIPAPGTVALVGGDEWAPGCSFDAELLAAAGSDRVLVLPTAAAYEHPERSVVRAAEWFGPLGGEVEGLMVLSRADAGDAGVADRVRAARFVYLNGSSPMHLRSVLKGSLVWEALVAAWRGGAVVAASSGAAMALTDPMVDARGGGLTLGLGLVSDLAVVPHFGSDPEDAHGQKMHRSVLLAPRGTPVAGVPERTALLRRSDGSWASAGEGSVAVFLDGAPAESGLAALPC